MTMTLRVFGIRHHGPGSARSLRAALDDFRPDAVLIEGPSDATGVLELAADPDMRPPVALLAYAKAEPARSIFWPLASFSPEWQALTWALAAGVPVRLVDLPAAHLLARSRPRDATAPSPPGTPFDPGAEPFEPGTDPLDRLARAGGYDDTERWWEDLVEHDLDAAGPFPAIAEAMAALRAEAPSQGRHEERREAAMRQGIRRAGNQGAQRVAMVCGAWHAPALADLAGRAAEDAALLKGLPRVPASTTWVPWTHGRLRLASGYGAGVESPGWYHHLFTTPDRAVVVRWLARVGRLLRDEGLAASTASVVEAVCLAETLAALRGRPLAGLPELTDATRSVLTGGADLPLALVHDRLVVGEALGTVPERTPMVPLARDLAATQRRLRLKPQAERRDVDLDLRQPVGLARSRLLHRLLLLHVPWGTEQEAVGATGTFRERWALAWDPELSVRLIEAGMWGTTVAAGATARAAEEAGNATELGALTALAMRCILADLPEATALVARRLAEEAAVDTEAGRLMDALPALARALRYSDVRSSDTGQLAAILDGMVTRLCIGLGGACASLDDDAARRVSAQIGATSAALAALDRPDLRAAWLATLGRLGAQPGLHGLVAGRVTRLLLDAGELDAEETGRRLALALSPGEEPARSAAWVEGLLTGSGQLLLHDPALLGLLDGWVTGLGGEAFQRVLPLLRRAFTAFAEPERRLLGEQLRRRGGAGARRRDRGGADGRAGAPVDTERADAVLPVVELLLGLDRPDQPGAERPDLVTEEVSR
jgi:Family of unknown function (DUF5682)